jgi:hypothetical protein
MRLLSATLMLATLGLSPAFAQQDLTTDAAGAANAQVTIDPSAAVSAMPQTANILTGLYATLATVELCDIAVSDTVTTAMDAHRTQMETSLSMDEATSTKAYDTVRADVEKTGVDCAEGSTDRQQAEAVAALYENSGAASPAPAAAAPAPAATDPAAPSPAPAAPAAQ